MVLNPAPAQQLSDALLQHVDVITPNEHEVELLGGAEALLARGVPYVVVTQGSRGARLFSRDGQTQIPPHPVTPRDTTGAGDAFCGALSARLACDGGVPALTGALRAAAIAGALATTVQGAVPSLPFWESIVAEL